MITIKMTKGQLTELQHFLSYGRNRNFSTKTELRNFEIAKNKITKAVSKTKF